MEKSEGGVEKTVDNLGRVVIPMDFRRKIGINKNSQVKMYLREDGIYITTTDFECVLCKRQGKLHEELKICSDCINKIKRI